MSHIVPVCPFCAAEAAACKWDYDAVSLRACGRCMNPFLVRFEEGNPVTERMPGVPDIREDVPKGSVLAGVLGTLPEALEALPVLPEIPQRILAMVNDPLVSMSELADLIAKDAVISVKIFKMANSAFYSSTHEIRDLKVACARLGLRIVANTVYAVANGNLYRTSRPEYRAMMQDLWRHSLATAHCADELGVRLKGIDKSALFESGLLHDIGKLVLFDMITTRYKGNVGRLRESPELLIKVLQRFHALVGLHVVQHWDAEQTPCFVTYYHGQCDDAPSGRQQQYADAISVANELAHTIGYKLGEEEPPPLSEHPALERLGMPPDELEALHESIQDKIESMIDLFALM